MNLTNISKLSFPVICAALCSACGAPSDSSSDVALTECLTPAPGGGTTAREGATPTEKQLAAVTAQGARWQGIGWQGVHLQGYWYQGVQLQGYWYQGYWYQGYFFQGATLNGTALETVTPEGNVITGDAMVGAEFELDNGERIKLEAVDVDPNDSDLTWYTLTHEGNNICGEGGRGMFVDGVWDFETGTRLAESEIPEGAAPYTFSCDTGVLAKCVNAGYKPWLGEQAADLHQACTRMFRADYCGDGVTHTENGTLIDIFDVQGIQVPEATGEEMQFEAAWGPNGAVCVNQTRYADSTVEDGPISPSCWSSLPRCDSLDQAVEMGAVVANTSQQQERLFCEMPSAY